MFKCHQGGKSSGRESQNVTGEEYLDNFSFLRCPQRHDDQCTFNRVLNTYRRFNAALISGLQKIKW